MLPGLPRALIPPVVALLALAALALLGPLVWSKDPLEHDVMARLQGPTFTHPAGTDNYGRDILARLLLGARPTVLGALAVSVAVNVIGLGLAGLAVTHRLVGLVVNRVIDALLAVPSLITALALTSVLGPSFTNLLVALTVSGWSWYARVYRGALVQRLADEYVEGAVVIGATRWRVLTRHILPNMVAPIIVLTSANLGSAMLGLAALSFLGLGIQPPTPEWGAMINESRVYLQSRPWQVLAPGLCITFAVMVVNLAGDAIRDALDPRLRRTMQ